jgi:hypothetical protein
MLNGFKMSLHTSIYGKKKYASIITNHLIVSRCVVYPILEEDIIKDSIKRR